MASVGDTLVFTWTGSNHNVYELAAGQTTCPDNFFASGRVATMRGDSGASPVSITLSAPGVRTFACEVSDHCEMGQIVVVTTRGNDPTLTAASAGSLAAAPVTAAMAAIVLAGYAIAQ
eukprot:COSAG06_NODE_15473_length_1068_cov_4.836332_2_plen_118_part_00